MPRLGMSVGAQRVRAVIVDGNTIVWAGAAEWSGLEELSAVIGRLAADAGRRTRTVRIALDRDVVQLRTVVPAPPLSNSAARRYATLETERLFRGTNDPLTVDARIIRVDARTRALWAAAAPEPLLAAILSGCAQAGLTVASLGPGAEVVRHATLADAGTMELIFPNGGTTEVVAVGLGGAWRSRLITGVGTPAVPWHPALASLGEEASHFAPAFGAAIARSQLELLPPSTRTARTRASHRRTIRLLAMGIGLWGLAAAIHITRLAFVTDDARDALAAESATLDSALTERRELAAARRTLAEFRAAERRRSRHLELLGTVTAAVGDSTFLVAWHLGPELWLRLVGYSSSTARTLAALERAGLDSTRLEGPITREQAPGGNERERFSIAARRRAP